MRYSPGRLLYLRLVGYDNSVEPPHLLCKVGIILRLRHIFNITGNSYRMKDRLKPRQKDEQPGDQD